MYCLEPITAGVHVVKAVDAPLTCADISAVKVELNPVLLPPLSLADGMQITLAIVSVWALAAALSFVVSFLRGSTSSINEG